MGSVVSEHLTSASASSASRSVSSVVDEHLISGGYSTISSPGASSESRSVSSVVDEHLTSGGYSTISSASIYQRVCPARLLTTSQAPVHRRHQGVFLAIAIV